MNAATLILLSCAAVAHVQVQPFTLYQVEGPVSGPARSTITVRTADGARATAVLPSSESYTGYEPRTVISPAQGKRYIIADKARILSTYYLSPRESASYSNPKHSPICADQAGADARLITEEQILGVATFRYDSTLRNGTQRHSQWYAPSLSCFPLRHEVADLENGAWIPTFRRTPGQLLLEPPSPLHFHIPTDYREAAPSDQQKAVLELHRGVPFGSNSSDAGMQRAFDIMDRHYHESRQFKPQP